MKQCGTIKDLERNNLGARRRLKCYAVREWQRASYSCDNGDTVACSSSTQQHTVEGSSR